MAARCGSVRRVTRKESVSGSRAGERAERGLVHQRADDEMRLQKAPCFLPDQLRRLAPEHSLLAVTLLEDACDGFYLAAVRAG
jgi:hypothetical protein